MCVVSSVIVHAQNFPNEYWDWDRWHDLHEKLINAKKIDKFLEQEDCEMENKDKRMKEVFDRLDKIEKKVEVINGYREPSIFMNGEYMYLAEEEPKWEDDGGTAGSKFIPTPINTADNVVIWGGHSGGNKQ